MAFYFDFTTWLRIIFTKFHWSMDRSHYFCFYLSFLLEFVIILDNMGWFCFLTPFQVLHGIHGLWKWSWGDDHFYVLFCNFLLNLFLSWGPNRCRSFMILFFNHLSMSKIRNHYRLSSWRQTFLLHINRIVDICRVWDRSMVTLSLLRHAIAWSYWDSWAVRSLLRLLSFSFLILHKASFHGLSHFSFWHRLDHHFAVGVRFEQIMFSHDRIISFSWISSGPWSKNRRIVWRWNLSRVHILWFGSVMKALFTEICSMLFLVIIGILIWGCIQAARDGGGYLCMPQIIVLRVQRRPVLSFWMCIEILEIFLC